MNQTNSIRVLVVDHHVFFRRGLVTLLKIEPGMELVAQASDGIEAVEQFRTHQPDVTHDGFALAENEWCGSSSHHSRLNLPPRGLSCSRSMMAKMKSTGDCELEP